MENIKLDKDKIFEEANKLIPTGFSYSDELFKALGGEALNEIFDEYAIHQITNSIVYTQKVHPFFEDDGLDVIEDFLNKKISRSVGEFYNIKPEYILSLPPEEQANMATAVSEGNKDLEELLKYIWSKNIKTIACGGKSNPGYLYINVPIDDVRSISTFKSLHEKNNWDFDIDFIIPSNDSKSSLALNLLGPSNELYSSILSEFQINEKTDFKKTTDFSVLHEIDSGIDVITELHQAEFNHSSGMSEKEVEKLLEDSDKIHHEQYVELQEKYSNLQKQYDTLLEKHSELKQNFSTVKNFVVTKIGKIPLLGKRVIKLLNEDLKNNALPSPEEHSENEDFIK